MTKTLNEIKEYLSRRGFLLVESPGLLQPKFGYPFSPSAGHHVIDEIVVSNQEPQEIIKFAVIPDRSIRMYDVDKIGISPRHLSFFETLVFGYAGASEKLPKDEASHELFNLFLFLGLNPEKLLVTTFWGANAEGTSFSENEDKEFYDAWLWLGNGNVKKTKGRRNLFYSRKIGNPGGTGCELYYNTSGKFIEIGSQVNYKFKFTGGLERTRNAAILQGFGLERLCMALENVDNIGQISQIEHLKKEILFYSNSYLNEDVETTRLYDESLLKIADGIRAINAINLDSKNSELSPTQRKILKNFEKSVRNELILPQEIRRV